MAEELSPEEKVQFQAMEKQEAEEKVVIEAEKATPDPLEDQETAPVIEEKEKTVPVNVLAEERERRRIAEEKGRQLELNQARLDERLKLIDEKINPPAQPREIPDPDKDALGALKANTEEIKAFRDFQNRQVQERQQILYAQDVVSRASAQEAEFMKKNPDYGEASVFLKKSRAEEMAHLGMSPLQIQQTLTAEAMQLADSALKQGKDPAALVYDIAKSRGYAKAAAQNVTDAEKLARIAEGQRANTSLGNVNATPPKPAMSGKDLLAMDEDQFSTWLDKLPAKDRSKFLGA